MRHERPTHQGAGAADQAGVPVRAESRDRRADLADRGAAGPAVDVPKERTSPTQPFPTRPAPFDRQGVTEDDLIDFTPALRAEALEVVKRYKIGPALHAARCQQPRRSAGDVAAAGRRRRRELARRVVRSGDQPPLHPLAHESVLQRARPGQSGAVGHGLRGRAGASCRGRTAWRRCRRRGRRWRPGGWWRTGCGRRRWRAAGTVQGLPLIKPPYDRITAYDMNTATSSGRRRTARRRTTSRIIRRSRA